MRDLRTLTAQIRSHSKFAELNPFDRMHLYLGVSIDTKNFVRMKCWEQRLFFGYFYEIAICVLKEFKAGSCCAGKLSDMKD